MTTDWPTISYRDFHDIPRAVVVDWRGVLYLLDCLFDYDADEYESTYTVYTLPDELRETVEQISWTDLCHRGQRVGELATSDVEFDTTRRRSLNPKIFERFVESR